MKYDYSNLKHYEKVHSFLNSEILKFTLTNEWADCHLGSILQ